MENPSIGDFEPAMVFEAAFDSEQIVGSAIDELNFSLLVQKDLNE